jgi:hypothetical protein
MLDIEGITVAERVQLVASKSSDGLMAAPGFALTAAALIELCLRGRIGSVQRISLILGTGPVKLIVLDKAPTGNPVLDVALTAIVAQRTGQSADRWIVKLWPAVPKAVFAELERREIATAVRTRKGHVTHLRIDAIDWTALERRTISEHRAAPEAVTDPFLGAVVDVVDHQGDAFSHEFSARPFITRAWHSESNRATIVAILRAQMLRTGMQ